MVLPYSVQLCIQSALRKKTSPSGKNCEAVCKHIPHSSITSGKRGHFMNVQVTSISTDCISQVLYVSVEIDNTDRGTYLSEITQVKQRDLSHQW